MEPHSDTPDTQLETTLGQVAELGISRVFYSRKEPHSTTYDLVNVERIVRRLLATIKSQRPVAVPIGPRQSQTEEPAQSNPRRVVVCAGHVGSDQDPER